MTPLRGNTVRLPVVGLALLAAWCPSGFARENVLWTSSPYRVLVTIDADSRDLNPTVQRRLARSLGELVDRRLGLFWRTKIVAGANPTPEEPRVAYDKRIVIQVVAQPDGYHLEAVEHDATLDHAAPPIEVVAAEPADLPERLYAAVIRGFRPIARVQRDPSAADRMTLAYRAADRAPASGLAAARPGQLLAPYRRQLDREGNLVETRPVRWTYLIAESNDDEAATRTARIVSHSRRPFGARPSGRVEQLAIVSPIDNVRPTTLRLHALDQPDAPLPGYEVLLGRPGEMEFDSLGYTDDTGRVALPETTGVWMAHIKCGTLVVASIPVAYGVADEVLIPLLDERSRLRAELDVTSLREELIDTVARRKILAERIKRLADVEQIDAAKALLSELEDLPGRTQFSRRLQAARRSAKADHPIAKARLDRLFTTTEAALNAALDPRETRGVAELVQRAEQDAEIRAASEEQATQDG